MPTSGAAGLATDSRHTADSACGQKNLATVHGFCASSTCQAGTTKVACRYGAGTDSSAHRRWEPRAGRACGAPPGRRRTPVRRIGGIEAMLRVRAGAEGPRRAADRGASEGLGPCWADAVGWGGCQKCGMTRRTRGGVPSRRPAPKDSSAPLLSAGRGARLALLLGALLPQYHSTCWGGPRAGGQRRRKFG